MGETGSTSSRDLALLLGRSKVRRPLAGLFCSLVVGVFGVLPLNAAERLEVQLDEMLIPIPIDELGSWVNSRGRDYSELTAWINLLSQESREVLLKLLQAPLLKDRSMARQILQSWAGRQLLDEVSDLIRVDEDRSGESVLKTLESLLEKQTIFYSILLFLLSPFLEFLRNFTWEKHLILYSLNMVLKKIILF